MDPNPYESPRTPSEPRPKSRWLRRKPWWGYIIAVITGAFLIGGLLVPPLAVLDDAGGLQMLIGAFLGLVIYALLF